jgi:hypothetical protein
MRSFVQTNAAPLSQGAGSEPQSLHHEQCDLKAQVEQRYSEPMLFRGKGTLRHSRVAKFIARGARSGNRAAVLPARA